MISIPKETPPLLLRRFENDGIVYELEKPLLIDVEYQEQDRLWIFRHQVLNLWGQGERHEDAMRDLVENFSYLWEAFAEEDDSLLDSKALQIKRLLIQNVRTTRTGV